MKGISTILDNKKWVFAYVVFFAMCWLLKGKYIDSGDFVLVMVPFLPMVIGANSFDKSVWRKDDPNN